MLMLKSLKNGDFMPKTDDHNLYASLINSTDSPPTTNIDNTEVTWILT